MSERNRAMKKVFALLLSLVMVVSMMPSLAFAEGSEDASTAQLEEIFFSMSPDAEDDEALDIEKTGDNAYTCTTYDSVTTLYAKAKSNNDENYHVRAVIQNGWQRLCITLNDNTWMSLKSAPVNMTVLVGPGTGAKKDNEDVAYTITFAKKPTLISLIVRDNDTLRPVFDPLKTEYTVGVPEDTDTIAMRVTPQTYNASMTINNEKASSSEDFQLTMKYDENGRMEVPIELTAAAGTPAFTYYLTFIKESKGDTPVISVQPQDLQAYDSKPRTLSIKATANGDLSYQWYQASSQENSKGTAIDGATEASYEITGQVEQTETSYYYCVVTNTNDEGATFTAISDTAKVTTKVDPTPTVELQTSEGEALPDDGYAYDMNQEGVTAIQAVPVSRVEGGTYTYEWKTCDTENGYFSINIPGSNPTTEQSFTPPVVKDSAAYYRCYVTYTVGGESFTAASPAVLVKTTAYSASAPDIYGQPKAVTAVVGGKPSRLTCSVYPPTDGGVLSYQWYQGTDDTDKTTFSPVEGATSKNYTPETSVEEKSVYYYCKVTNTLESISGQIYTASVDSDIVSVTFTMPTFKGEGTEDSPYLIKTLDDLQQVQKYVGIGVSFEEKYFRLENDLTLPADWKSIGSIKDGETSPANGKNINPFSGIFDGNNKKITVATGGKPLFGYVRYAVIKNLKIYGEQIDGCGLVNGYTVDYGKAGVYTGEPVETVTIDNVTLLNGSSTKYSGFIGGMASGVNVVYIRNSVIEDNVTIGYDKSSSEIGSFAGAINGYIENCVSYATVYGVDYVGGIAGRKAQTMGPCQVKNCSFEGSIEASGTYVGGIVGSGYAGGSGYNIDSAPNTPCVTIQNCYAAGTIKASDYVGGIFGGEPACKECWANGIGYIQNNHFAGTIECSGSHRGGIIGYMRSLDRYNIISNNFYLDQCGADNGIGAVDIIDLTSSSYGRSDDPMGTDADSLAKAVSSSEMASGEVTELLNQGDGSYQNWVNGTSYPVHSAEAVIYKISLSGTYPTSFYIGDGFSAEGMEIIGHMTDGTTKTLSLDDVTFTGYDKNTKGQQTITVDYRGILTQYNVNVLVQNAKSITVYLTIYGDEIHDSDTDGTSHTLSAGNLTTWLSRKTITLTENSTVQNALEQAVIGTGLELIADPATQYGWYLRGIIKDGKELSEFTNGKNSGWMYTVNGTHPEIGAGKYYPNDGDVIIWHYTDDYTKEEGSEKWNTVETASSSKDISASVKGDAAVASVSSADLTALIDTAKKDGSAAVQLNITGADKASEITVEMPKASLNDLATRTDAALNVKTALGSVSMDKTVMKAVVNGASADTVKLVLTKISDTETDVKLVSGDKTITDLGAGKITIALPVSGALQGKSLAAAYTDADGSLVKLSGKVVTIDGKQYYQIETAHMGTFTLNEEAAIDAAIAAQNGDMDAEKAARIKAGVENTTIKIWSTFSKKNNIQLNWTKSKGYKVDCYQVYKSTKRYSGYGTKAYYQTTTGTKNFYINTKELKKGTRYFYKVRGVRTINGEKVYTQWSNKAWRISRVNR